MNQDLLNLIAKRTGKSIESLQYETISDYRYEIEERNHMPMKIIKLFPFIGRGSVMGDYLITHAEANKQLDRALR